MNDCLPLDQKNLSKNSSITLDLIGKYIDEPWNWGNNGLSYNSKINPKIFNSILGYLQFLNPDFKY